MARDNWSITVDCRDRDYEVPTDVEVVELRVTATGGSIGLRGPEGETVKLRAAEYDIFKAPAIPNVRKVVRMETTAAMRYGAITLLGFRS
jgi:hypothetical protein